MKYLYLLIMLLSILTMRVNGQLTESFSDGDYTNNPNWNGQTNAWVINAAGQLQSNVETVNSTFYLSTANALATDVEWEFYVRLAFNTSSANYADVFLMASAADISANTTTGYFVRIGNTKDEISLYRKDGSSSTLVIDGVDGITNTSNNTLKIKVIRKGNNNWQLLRDITGTGNTYQSEGVANDNTYTNSAYFGFLIKQSTASFFKLHYLDDISIKPYVPDIIAPKIISAAATTTSSVDILFNEAIDVSSAQNILNYLANNGLGNPMSAVVDNINPALVHIVFSSLLLNGMKYTLAINNISDLSGNIANSISATFSYYTAQRYDVVIDEIMADPDPAVGLPSGKEWIELKNTSAFPIEITGWKIGDGSSISGAFPALILQPDSFVIVCSSGSLAEMKNYGNAISVTSFPALSNDGKQLTLYNNNGVVIHSVYYTDKWYQNGIKANGGWTLEMIDTHNACSGINNWKASIDSKGGTPGKINSVDAINPDITAPQIVKAYTTSDSTIVIVFNESIDSSSACLVTNYNISEIGKPQKAIPTGPSFVSVLIELGKKIMPDNIYSVVVSNITDCSGNTITDINNVRFGLPKKPNRFDIVVNEILFNPFHNGTDYVELYNRSNNIIDLKDLYLANRNSASTIDNKNIISQEHQLLFPKDYIVVTKDPSLVKSIYICQQPNAFITMDNMPSYNDDKGNVIVMDINENIIDEISYSDNWHFKLIDNTEGIALERININDTTLIAAAQEKNWHSASSSSGYGTPTYKNSQYYPEDLINGSVNISPKTFSPDNDGWDDFITIDYAFEKPGYIANITIFNASGIPVRYLERSSLCGIKGSFRWDGLGEKQQSLPAGIYVILTEIFNLEGKKKQFKQAVVLAKK